MTRAFDMGHPYDHEEAFETLHVVLNFQIYPEEVANAWNGRYVTIQRAAIPHPHYYAGQRAAREGFQLDGS